MSIKAVKYYNLSEEKIKHKIKMRQQCNHEN